MQWECFPLWQEWRRNMKNYSSKTSQQTANKQDLNSQSISNQYTDNQAVKEQISQGQTTLVEQNLQPLKHKFLAQHMSEEHLQQLIQKMEEAKKMEMHKQNYTGIWKIAAAAAVLIGAFILLPNTSAAMANAMEQIPIIGQLVKVVTFRDYQYESDRNMADIEIPEIQPADNNSAANNTKDNSTNNMENNAGNNTLIDNTNNSEHGNIDSNVQENLNRTTAEINAEIKEITDKLIAEFESNLKTEGGYQDVVVKSEVLTTTPEYFTLKLICYQGAGSGYQWNYFYTIDLNTGERLQLKDIFADGADFITPISDNIKQQMQEQMDADENVYYWLHDEIEEWNFKAITEETSFYLNEKGNVVIGFNEGDVAPMYMGTVEFEIPAEVIADIRKE